ncbi:hypothetical protein ABT063_37460 [Streptomyces sp. NPDC002838]|uniref:hypothetical protein n=1 Tax=Streptomyces sp. NPDC002838 TaxID=3154436 RepID=UPI0033276A1D
MIDPADIDIPDFLTRWYGPPTASSEQLPPEASWLPEPLRQWYGLASRWPELQSGGNRMYRPSHIQPDRGKAVFMEDSTGDWVWAFDSAEPDRVYEGEPGGAWSQAPENLAEFLAHATVRETIVLTQFGRLCAQVPDEFLPEILAPMEEVGFRGWKWPRPDQRIFLNDSLAANVGPAVDPQAPWRNRDGYAAVRVAGIEPSLLEYLDSVSSLAWIDLGPDR